MNQVRGDSLISAGAYFCSTLDTAVISAFNFGTNSLDGELPDPSAIRDLVKQSRTFASNDDAVGRFSVYADGAVSERDAQAVADSMLLLEQALGFRAHRPSYAFLFSRPELLASSYPERYPTKQPGSISFTPPSYPSVAFIQRDGNGFSVHELTHLIVTKFRMFRGVDIPAYAEEALAQGLGGAGGRSFASWASAGGRAWTRARVLAVLTDTASLDGTRTRVGEGLSERLLVLAAAYRVALLDCARFPRELLLRENLGRNDDVFNHLVRLTGRSKDEIVSQAVDELNPSSSIIARSTNASRGVRRSCVW